MATKKGRSRYRYFELYPRKVNNLINPKITNHDRKGQGRQPYVCIILNCIFTNGEL